MSEIENPLAFPSLDDGRHNFQEGMSLRDWFAGQALVGLFSINANLGQATLAETAKAGAQIAYGFADAMLEARADFSKKDSEQ